MRFGDYKGPTGAYITTGERIVPIDSAEGIAALGHSAMLFALGTGPESDRFRRRCAEDSRRAAASRSRRRAEGFVAANRCRSVQLCVKVGRSAVARRSDRCGLADRSFFG
jgi:hypothetical protein